MLKIATYNIQFSLHPDQIHQNILSMVGEGVSIICLQEVVSYNDETQIIETLRKKLGEKWKAITHLGKEHGIIGMGNSILWDSSLIMLAQSDNITLPYSKKYALHEKIFSELAGGESIPIQRLAIIADFLHNNKKFRITNIHLDHNGGSKNRSRQLTYIAKVLRKKDLDIPNVICGDFNNFDLLSRGNERKMYKIILDEYIEATENIGWTADLHSIDTTAGSKLLQMFVQRFNLHIKKQLDFIWGKNLKFSDTKKQLVSGSDHLPVITTLSF